MKEIKLQILALLKAGPMNPSKVAERVGISRQATHRHLKALLKDNRIEKQGLIPHVFYTLASLNRESRVQESMLFFNEHFLANCLKQDQVNKAYELFCSEQAAPRSGKPDFAFMLDAAAVYSSNIEGNSLNLNSFLNSRMQAKKIRPKEAQEIEDLVEAYLFSQNHGLNEKNMLRTHAILSKGFISKGRQGVYRMEPIGVFSDHGLEYLAVEPQFVNHEMYELFKVVSQLLTSRILPMEVFFWASWLHLMIVLIHPFSDGNGRIARLCEKWFLVRKLGTQMVFLSSEEYYFKERPNYYSALRLGANYWEADFSLSMPFLKLLPQVLLNR